MTNLSNVILEEHLGYLSDPVRHARLRAAVATLIHPGDHVVDLGCGSGVLGLLCLQQGAQRVDGIDETAMIEAARQTFRRSGFSEQVHLHQDSTFRIQLEDRADVLVCDHVGYFGIDYGILDLMADARARFLKPGGRMLPRRVQLLLGAVESDACRDKAEAWSSPKIAPEYHWLRNHGINAKHAVDLSSSELLSDLVLLADLELGLDHPSVVKAQADLTIARDGLLDGVMGCFNAELAEGVWMSNSPCAEEAISRHQVFLPISERLQVSAGDLLSVTIRQVPAENLMAWQVHHHPSGRRFSHSTFAGQLLTQAELARQRLDRRPRLNARGMARNTVLGYVDGTRSASEIEQAVLRDHPALLPSHDEIRRFVALTLGRDTE